MSNDLPNWYFLFAEVNSEKSLYKDLDTGNLFGVCLCTTNWKKKKTHQPKSHSLLDFGSSQRALLMKFLKK